MLKTKYQNGAVSLFIVIFVALLLVTMTISFTRIMNEDLKQASVTDLSKSAYDSAQAGVEDAKRALLRMQNICTADGVNSSNCISVKAAVSSSICNNVSATLSDIGNSGISGGEVKVQTNGANKLDQAYTCLKVVLNTNDYLGSVLGNDSAIIPLKAANPSTGNAASFNTVKLEWFSAKDISSTYNGAISLLSSGSPLIRNSDWPANRPPIMRAQLMQFDTSSVSTGGFLLSDFDANNNANTLFLYPRSSGSTLTNFQSDNRRDKTSIRPTPIRCSSSVSSGGYSCQAIISLSNPIGGGDNIYRAAYLRLTSLYNKSSYRVTMYNCSGTTASAINTCVTSSSSTYRRQFNGVQPEVDSTGRANDLLRRVKSRVELSDTTFPYPDAAVDASTGFCKDFLITDDSGEYDSNAAGTTCNP